MVVDLLNASRFTNYIAYTSFTYLNTLGFTWVHDKRNCKFLLHFKLTISIHNIQITYLQIIEIFKRFKETIGIKKQIRVSL